MNVLVTCSAWMTWYFLYAWTIPVTYNALATLNFLVTQNEHEVYSIQVTLIFLATLNVMSCVLVILKFSSTLYVLVAVHVLMTSIPQGTLKLSFASTVQETLKQEAIFLGYWISNAHVISTTLATLNVLATFYTQAIY